MRAWLVFTLGCCLTACPSPSNPDAGPLRDHYAPDSPSICARASDCDDLQFCNGVELCEPGNADADARGCVAGTRPCAAGEDCDEEGDFCSVDCGEPDADNDGHDRVGCGSGDDCDDTDPDRYPGNPEVCDTEAHDEDCNPETVGDTDADEDSVISSACCNGEACGLDCDDSNPAINPSRVEACNGHDDDCDLSVDEDATTAPLCPGGMCTGGRCSFTGWDRTLGAMYLDDRGQSVAMDDAGNIYVAGTFSGTVNAGGDTYDAAGHSDDAFLISYDPSGGVRWFMHVASPSTDSVKQVAVGPMGTVFFSGTLNQNHFDFGGGERTNPGTQLHFLLALDAATGAYRWDRPFRGAPAIAALDDGGVLVATGVRDPEDVGGPVITPPVGTTGKDLHLVRFTADGSHVWDVRYGGSGIMFADDVAVAGDVIIAGGDYYGDIDLGDGMTRSGMGRDYYVASYSLLDGSFAWALAHPGPDTQTASGVATDGVNVYVVGTNEGTISFDTDVSHTATTERELWLLSLTASGGYRWHKTQQATSLAAAADVDIVPAGGAVITGYFTGTINLGGGGFESTRDGAGSSGFIGFFDEDGGYDTDRPFAAGPEEDSAVYLTDVVIGIGGSLAVVGFFRGSANFGSGGRISPGGTDMVTLRLAR